mgnify:CR=1 FL=1
MRLNWRERTKEGINTASNTLPKNIKINISKLNPSLTHLINKYGTDEQTMEIFPIPWINDPTRIR